MKKSFSQALRPLLAALFLCLCPTLAPADPVERGMWTIIELPNGQKVKVEPVGDEFCCYMRAENGAAYQWRDGQYVQVDVHQLLQQSSAMRAQFNQQIEASYRKYFNKRFTVVPPGAADYQKSPLRGEKRALVILVDFKNIQFRDHHTPEFYEQMLNYGGPAELGYTGSVRDYFLFQSEGQFSVHFDVTSVYSAPEESSYYGGSTTNSTKMSRTNAMFKKIAQSLPDTLDWDKYDWDDDGEIDLVFFIYAGYGSASVSSEMRDDYIWAHKWGFYPAISVGGKKLQNYACACEMRWTGSTTPDRDSGIGTICHEFSHCLGLLDTYDLCSSCDTHTMGELDVMDTGLYNGNSFTPAAFSTFERMVLGWCDPEEMQEGRSYVLQPASKAGVTRYVATNPANANEFLYFEAIDRSGWCAPFTERQPGLMIVHINYDRRAWNANRVNCFNGGYTTKPRYLYIPANRLYNSSGRKYTFWGTNRLYRKFSYTWEDGTECNIKLENIYANADGTVSFNVLNTTGVQRVVTPYKVDAQVYGLDGQQLSAPRRGVNVVLGEDGHWRKVFVP